jgi:hypothetical protein
VAVIDMVRRFAFATPHVLVVEGRGGTPGRLATEAWCRLRGWAVVAAPRDADLVALAGQAPPGLETALDRVRRTVPFPREFVRIDQPEQVAVGLSDAAERLRDWSRQRDGAARALEEEAVEFRHGDRGEGLFRSNVAEGPPAGLTMAYRSADRDGLSLDVLHVPLGPILHGWPAGLRLRTRLQGDIVQAADTDVDAIIAADGGPGSYWDEPWRAALAGDEVSVVVAERRRAASHLDSVARFLVVAGEEVAALRAARLRDQVLGGEDVGPIRAGVGRLRRRLDRLRLLDRLTAGVAPVPASVAEREGLTGPALRASGVPADLRQGSTSYPGFEPVVAVGSGDSRARWRQWIAEAEQSLVIVEHAGDRVLEPVGEALEGPRGHLHADPSQPVPTGRLLWLIEDLVLGQVWSRMRLLVASFDPDPHQLAAAVEVQGQQREPTDA